MVTKAVSFPVYRDAEPPPHGPYAVCVRRNDIVVVSLYDLDKQTRYIPPNVPVRTVFGVDTAGAPFAVVPDHPSYEVVLMQAKAQLYALHDKAVDRLLATGCDAAPVQPNKTCRYRR